MNENRNRLITHFKHAVRAQAAFDALGEDFEFLNPTQEEVRTALNSPKPLRITDDTQMTLFILESLVGQQDLQGLSQAHRVAHQAHALVQWLHTQEPGWVIRPSTLADDPWMHRQAAPGRTCLASCRALALGRGGSNDSNGCGTVMRQLPYVLLGPIVGENLAVSSARLTHGGDEITRSTELLHSRYFQALSGKTCWPKARAEQWAAGGWTADSCVAIASECAQMEDVEEVAVQSIAHAGDSDSTAAVAGALWGMRHGRTPWWYSRVVEAPLIESLLGIVR